jgi:TonB family protein
MTSHLTNSDGGAAEARQSSGVETPMTGRSPSVPIWPAAAFSILTHVGLMVWLGLPFQPTEQGRAGFVRDAVGVALISSEALDGLQTQPQPDLTGSASGATPTLQSEAQPAAHIQPAEPAAKPDPVQTDSAVLPGSEPAPPIPRAAERSAEPKATVEAAESAAIELRAPGAATNPIIDGEAASTAATLAPGVLSQFEYEVREALGRHRPPFTGLIGHVEIEFSLGDAGELTTLRLAKSSGIERLDKLVMRAIEATRFPRPPAGSTAAQRRFSVPFDFQRIQNVRNKTSR